MNVVNITKVEWHGEVKNSSCWNFYYLATAKVPMNDSSVETKFIIWFDIFDALEWSETESVTKEQLNEYAEEMAYCFAGAYCSNNPQSFIDLCNATIQKYK